ncbi:hypothetical protein CHLNCDRAFT_139064 [Chlorella variabilis]|uniref:Uncharacterized protein n=1 Tax=Chlorella variabilis TaxID=554065 RepID=E1ZPA0_CHLVA|nr:hypothetical protein CHLNCDRAFT_139064 [Chlorella variabilis]EFN52215.1 hypothetical protein CHLNCDRAFT_139064 [Chlorella variabilis]|eukprot:XP_005844317.1 hypothetical protein CHLNCDRAFT_139064 [Chlorella variabilis]
MEEADGYEGGGYGKAQRGRRHRTQTGKTPYSRPGPKPVAKEGPLKEQPASEPAPGGLFGSLRTLITKVPVLGSYFGTPAAAAAEPPPTDDEMDGDVEVVLESQTQGAGDGGSGKEQMQGGRELARAAASPASLPRPGLRGASQGPAQPPAPQAAAAHTRRVAFQSPMGTGDEAEEAAAGTPQVPPRGVDGDGSGTPYDSVLAMLRQGPLATNSPRSFPRPRSSSLLTAGAGRTPGPALAFGGSTSPSPLPPSGGPRAGAGFGGSRLGLHAAGGGSSTPSTGLRTAYTARSNSRFSRTPVHMQPLAAGRPAGSGGGGTSRFGLAAAAVAAAAGDEAAGAGSGPGTALLSPAPLAWTPMRSNLATGGRGGAPASGTKRKADSASPDADAGGGDAGTISLLDAQRRIRQRSEPVGGGAGARGDRRAWNAGRTPFHPKAAGLSRFGAAQQQKQQPPAAAWGGLGGCWEPPPQQENGASPAAPPGLLPGAPAAAAPAGGKATTDTARRILATLDALDKVVAASPTGVGAAAVAAAMGEAQQGVEPAASPPPTDSLGFAGLPRGEPAHEPADSGGQGERARSVTFGNVVSFAPTPTPASSPMAKVATAAVPAAAAAGTASGWGEALLASNKAAAAQAAPAEATGGGSKQQQVQQPTAAFTFGLAAAQPSSAGAAGTPTMKQRSEIAAPKEPAAELARASEAPAPLFGASKPAEPAVPAFASPKPANGADTSTAPKFAFGGTRSSDMDRKVAASIAAASTAAASGLAPTFVFGGKKAGEGKEAEGAWTPLTAAKTPAEAEKANQAAAEAAKSPLPESDLSDEEPPPTAPEPAPAPKPAEAAKPAAASGGWDLSFLQKNQAAAQQALEAAAKEAEAGKPSAAAADAPKFSFAAPAQVPAPASTAASGWGEAFLKSNQAAASTAAEAAAKEVDAAAPSGGATAAAPGTSAPASGAGWGDTFLKANQAAASQAAEDAAKEIAGAAPGGSASASQPGFEPAAAPVVAAPPFNFGAASQQPIQLGAAPTASSGAAVVFGASAPPPGSTGFAFSTQPPASSAAVPAGGFAFGATPATAPPVGGFGFGASSGSGGFANGMDSIEMVENGTNNNGASAAAPAPTFQFGSAPPGSAPTFGSSGFGFGAQPQQPGFSSTPAFAFGAVQPQQPAPAPAAGGMVPNNPFGGGMGGGFSIGSTGGGGSQSESGRRKLKVKRAGGRK